MAMVYDIYIYNYSSDGVHAEGHIVGDGYPWTENMCLSFVIYIYICIYLYMYRFIYLYI